MRQSMEGIESSAGTIEASVDELVGVIEKNSAASEEVAASAEETPAAAAEIQEVAASLAAGAQRLMDVLARFRGAGIGFDFVLARRKHMEWRDKVAAYGRGEVELDADQVSAPDRCDLGEWIYGTALERYGALADMARLEERHRRLHEAIGAAVRADSRGQERRSSDPMAKMERLSSEVVSVLDALEHEV